MTPALFLRVLLALWLCCVLPLAVRAAQGPSLDCASGLGEPAPNAVGEEPGVKTLFAGEALTEWQPPDCTGWQPRKSDVLVATAARFREPGGIDALARRLTRVSDFTGIRYWSVTRRIWRPLVTEAHALSDADPEHRRQDFAPQDLKTGASLHFWQAEATPAGELVYRVDVQERSATRLVFTLENASPASFMLMPLFEPGDYQTFVLIEQESDDIWRYYSLQRATTGVVLSTSSHRSSYVNRAAALFRYLAGRPTDAEPPLAPE
jgi:hypothetical protein